MTSTPSYSSIDEEAGSSWCSSRCIIKTCIGSLCCIVSVLAMFGLYVYVLMPKPPITSFCDKGYLEAYESGMNTIQKSYAFSEWKGIDWKRVADAGHADVQEAERTGKVEHLHTALRKAAASIPDGHVYMGIDLLAPCASTDGNGANRKAKERADAIGGGFGITISPLDDGTVILTSVVPDSQAAQANLAVGQRVNSVDGLPIIEAVKATGLSGWMWARINPATAAHRLTEQYRTIVRSPVGTSRVWTIDGVSVTLEAKDDDFVTWNATRASTPLGRYNDATGTFTGKPYLSRKLPSGYGYIGIRDFMLDNSGQVFTDLLAAVSDTPGLVIDVRSNFGGSDDQGAAFNGFFLPQDSGPVFYEEVAFQPKYDSFRKLWTKPTSPFYTKPVVVLINRGCISTCEGIPKGFHDLPRSRSQIVGFEGTAASFGMAGAKATFPGDFAIEYPFGRSLDERGQIQLDSDAQLLGGILPTVPIPRNSTNLIKLVQQLASGTMDIELAHAEAELSKMIAATT